MIYVADTHPLVWHLENSPSLSDQAAAILEDPSSRIIIPTIVLAEIWHLYHRKRISTSPDAIRSRILASANCAVYPLDEPVLELLPPGLELHDAIIVATALVYRDVIGEQVAVVTKDRAIHTGGLVDVVW
jgi:predicted nucleic acid-binding protein